MNECLSVVYVTASAHLAYTEEYQLHHLESTLVNACMLNLCDLEGRWEEGKRRERVCMRGREGKRVYEEGRGEGRTRKDT